MHVRKCTYTHIYTQLCVHLDVFDRYATASVSTVVSPHRVSNFIVLRAVYNQW